MNSRCCSSLAREVTEVWSIGLIPRRRCLLWLALQRYIRDYFFTIKKIQVILHFKILSSRWYHHSKSFETTSSRVEKSSQLPVGQRVVWNLQEEVYEEEPRTQGVNTALKKLKWVLQQLKTRMENKILRTDFTTITMTIILSMNTTTTTVSNSLIQFKLLQWIFISSSSNDMSIPVFLYIHFATSAPCYLHLRNGLLCTLMWSSFHQCYHPCSFFFASRMYSEKITYANR